MCGMSVVGREYEGLKRFNLAELYEARRVVRKDGKEDGK